MTELFTFPDQQVDPAHPDARVAVVNVTELRKALQVRASGAAPSSLRLNLSASVTVECQTAAVEWFEDDSVAWRGIVPGLATVNASVGIKFTENGVRLSGLVLSLNGDWLITPHDTLSGVLITPSGMDTFTCGDPTVYTPQPAASSEDSYYAAEDDAKPAVIDILALYPTATVKALAHGFDDIIAYLRQAQEVTNTIFSNSGINAWVRIVDIQEVSAMEGETVTELLDDVIDQDFDEGPGRKISPGDRWELVSRLRDAAGADIVVLLSDQYGIKGNTRVAGIAASIPEPVAADHSDLSVAVFSLFMMPLSGSYNFSYAFAHELGHLLGGKHDRITQPQRSGLDPTYDYAHAYVAPDRSFVTIMGYPRPTSGLSWIPYYSSPEKTWQGQPVGIPLGQPGASDVARLFHLSTRVVSRYRGEHAPRWAPVYLNLMVEPSIGGFVTPDQLGPYPQGRQVSVRATARSGYVFDHWVLDGLTMHESAQMVLMDKNRSLKAVFVAGTTAQPAVSLGPLALRYGCQLAFMPPPGPSFPAGTNIKVVAIPGYAAQQASVPLVWLFQEEGGLATSPLASITHELILERDIVIDLQPSGLRFTVWGQRSLSLNTTSRLVIQASWGTPAEGFSYPAGQPVEVTVAAAPEGTTMMSSESVTDASGLLRVTVATGNEEGELALKVKLKDAPERSAVLVVAAVSAHPEQQEEPVSVRVIEHSSQQIPEGATPEPLKILVTHQGKPVAATLDITVNAPAHGISVTDAHPTTGADGVATVTFAPQSGTSRGLTTLLITDESSGNRVNAQIAVLPRKQYLRSLMGLTVYSVPEDGHYQPFALAVSLSTSDSVISHFVTLPAGIKVTFTLESGTTGITLDSSEAFYTGTTIYINATAPTAPGTAKVTVNSEYADPIVITINVG